jgi:hypothetical protein
MITYLNLLTPEFETDKFPQIFGKKKLPLHSTPVFLNRRAADRYRTVASIIPGRER